MSFGIKKCEVICNPMTALADREFKWTLGGKKLKGNVDFYKYLGIETGGGTE